MSTIPVKDRLAFFLESKEEMVKEESLKFFAIRKRLRPGPPGNDALTLADRDLIDAALIIKMVEDGKLSSKLPPSADNGKDKPSLNSRDRLSQEDESLLAYRIQNYGDIDARNSLVMANIGLVHLIANQFLRTSLRYEDLVQEGTMGLIRATETFEAGRGIRFSTYSVYWIRAKIQRFLQRADRDDIPSIIGAESLADKTGKKRRPRARKLSIERSQEEEGGRNLSELLASDCKDPEIVALQVERNKVIKEVLWGIVQELNDDRLKVIIEHRLLTDEPYTLTKVGEKLNMSREGARLLEAKMLKLAKQRLKKWRRP